MEINQEDATITHEATVGKIGDEQIFYLMTRGFSEEEASNTNCKWIHGTIHKRTSNGICCRTE